MDALSGPEGNRDRRRRSSARRRAGFTLAEITVAVSVFAVMAGGVVFSLTRAKYLSWSNRERLTALEACQSKIEEIRGVDFEQAFARFNATTADDPAGASPGQDFAVAGLTPQAGDADGFVGQVVFPGNGVQLFENVNDADLGMPRDLDLSGGTPDNLDHANDYVILPVRVRVDWRGPDGDQSVELVSYLVEREGF